MIKLNGKYTFLIGIEMVGRFNYIGTSLSGLIQEVKLKEKKSIQLFQRNICWKKW